MIKYREIISQWTELTQRNIMATDNEQKDIFELLHRRRKKSFTISAPSICRRASVNNWAVNSQSTG